MSDESKKKEQSECDATSVGHVSGVECPVCLESWPNDDLLRTKCNHTLCRTCIKRVLQTSLQTWEASSKCPVCRQAISIFNITWVGSGKVVVEPFNTIYDSVYTQGNTVGLASYHFSETDSYISYASAPPFWRLDNGTPPPVKKPFENPTYDPSTRTFRATVTWQPVTFMGKSKWVYKTVFSEDFESIESGEVETYDEHGNKTDYVWKYREDLFYERKYNMNRYLVHLDPNHTIYTTIYDSVYVQLNTVGLASYHFSEHESYISYASAPPYWRLDNGMSPPAKKPFENPTYDPNTHTFRATVTWWPVAFQGDVKWVYKIVFSEDFMVISDGEVVVCDLDGNETGDVVEYGVELNYERVTA